MSGTYLTSLRIESSGRVLIAATGTSAQLAALAAPVVHDGFPWAAA